MQSQEEGKVYLEGVALVVAQDELHILEVSQMMVQIQLVEVLVGVVTLK